MPNPIIRRHPLRTSKTPGRTEPIPPQMEAAEGDNIPYRGIVDHGVPVAHTFHDFAGYEDTEEGSDKEYEKEPDPIPVRIVTAGGRELRRARTWQDIVPDTTTVRKIAGRNEARTSIVIYNNSAALVWVGFTESVTAYTGFPVNNAGTLSLKCENEIFAVGTSGTPQQLCMCEEYSVEEPYKSE